MKDLFTVSTFAIGALLFMAFFSTLRPATVAAAVGGMEKPGRCSLTASPTPGCQTSAFAALTWSVAAMVTVVPKDRLPASH